MSISQEARLALLGWSFRGAGAPVRERVAFTADEIREALSGNLCRCGTYTAIIEAVQHAADIMQNEKVT